MRYRDFIQNITITFLALLSLFLFSRTQFFQLGAAAGSGTTVADVNKLLKQFEMMQKMMKQLKKSPKGFARKLGGMMGNPNAFRGLK